MLKAYKYCLAPNTSQKVLLNKHFGSCRFLYNLGLETKNNAYATHRKSIGFVELAHQLTDLKKGCEWLKEDTICLETLQVRNMVKNNKLAQSINDVSWSEFVRQIQYKAEWNGKNVLQIGTFEPSSKMCSVCGNNQILKLSDRQWTCLKCGTYHDRDVNAAINIKAIALKDMAAGNVVRKSVELPTLVGTMKQKNKTLGLCPK